MAIGDLISQPIPAVGTSGTSYASQLVAFLTEVKARLEAKVALTSLLAGVFDLVNNPLTNVKYLGLYEQTAAPSTPVGSLQKYQGNLYYVGPSGAVRITNGTTIDATGIGGIGQDYAAPAGLWYDVANLEYFAYSNTTTSPKQWARVGAHGFDVYGTLSSTTRVRLGWGGGSSYSLALPAALPADRSQVMLQSDGTLVTRNTVEVIPGSSAWASAAGYTNLNGNGWNIPTSGATAGVYYPIRCRQGDIIKSISLQMVKSSDNTNTVQIDLMKCSFSAFAQAGAGSFVATNNANNPGNITLTPSSPTPYTVGAGEQLAIVFTNTDSTPSAIDAVLAAYVTFV